MFRLGCIFLFLLAGMRGGYAMNLGLDSLKNQVDQLIGDRFSEIKCLSMIQNCRITDVNSYLDFKYISIFGNFVTEKYEIVPVVIFLEIEDDVVVNNEIHVDLSFVELEYVDKFYLKVDNFSPWEGFLKVISEFNKIQHSTIDDVRKFALEFGFCFHREYTEKDQLVVQYYRPPFAEDSLVAKAGSNQNPDGVWLIQFIFRSNLLQGYSVEPTGMGNEALLLRQLRVNTCEGSKGV